MSQLYPLLFQPVFKQRVWGGQHLSQFFPDLPAGNIGEAWVLSGHPEGQTPVANGLLAGEMLGDLQRTYGAALVGTHALSAPASNFPLLFKLLDAQDDLSVQVHPPDNYPGLPAGERGKTEMWLILHAEPESKIVLGLQPGVTRQSFADAIAQGSIKTVLREIPVRAGDLFYVPAGTVHALGTGLLVAEVQQSSDTTYRVYDYDRLGLDGQPRELHVEHALAVTQYDQPPAAAVPIPREPNVWQELCRSPFFVAARGECSGEWSQESSPLSFETLLILDGAGFVEWEEGLVAVQAGTTLLVPASQGAYRLRGEFHCLRVRIP